MRQYFPALAGNRALSARLGEEMAAGAFSHAYIIEGPKGSGRHTLAREMAMSAVCRERSGTGALPCGECPDCRKIAAGFCPDFITVGREPGKATLGVEAVRRLREGIAALPNDLPLKIYVIEDAETMTVQAQNAFLLTLEEPPAFVLFLLLTTEATALLPTVRSRAPVFRMRPLTDGELSAFLLEKSSLAPAARALERQDPAEFAAILRMSGGYVGAAETLLSPEARKAPDARRKKILDLLAALGSHDGSDRVFLLLTGERDREEAKAFLAAWQTALRDLILCCRAESPCPLFFPDSETAATAAEPFTAPFLLSLYRAAGKACSALLGNANLSLTLTRLSGEVLRCKGL